MDEAEFRRLGHRMVDLLGDYLESIEDRALYPDVEPRTLEQLFDEPIPEEPSSPDAVMAELEEKFLPYCTHVNHPGYFGLITPSPTPVGILGDFLASALNQNIGGYSIGPGGVAMERRTIRWLSDLIGYDERAGGNLTSGGMMANFTGLKLGRDWASGDEAQTKGLGEPWAIYASEERHVSIDKAVDAIGLGRESLRVIPTDDLFRVRVDALEEARERDKRDGVRPMAIVGIAGSTNTGAVDPLDELRAIADREHLWLHVDAAYGGGMLLSNRWPGLPGIQLADSVTIDPHKWFYAPLDVGALLVKDEERLKQSFGLEPTYLMDNRDASGERYQFYTRGFEQSKRLRSLKVWLSLKRYGTKTVGSWIDQNIEQAKHLAALADAHDDFAVAAPPNMSAVCIRYAPGDSELDDEDEVGHRHKRVAARIEDSGRFWISTVLLKGQWWFRICPVNIRTRLEHMDALFEAIEEESRRAWAGGP